MYIMSGKLKLLSNKICGLLSKEQMLYLLDITKRNCKNPNLIKLVDEIHSKQESQIIIKVN